MDKTYLLMAYALTAILKDLKAININPNGPEGEAWRALEQVKEELRQLIRELKS